MRRRVTPHRVLPRSDHRTDPFTTADLASMVRTLHLPDGEIRYASWLNFGRSLLVEFEDWHNTDGLDIAFDREDYLPWDEHPEMVGQSHVWLDWILRMHVESNARFLINPMMRLWHLEHEQLPDPAFWQWQIERSYQHMMKKWGKDIWIAQVKPTLFDVRPYRDQLIKELPG